jgi:predicted TIM-barrel fold metal-dependent hydrolase
MLIDFHVHLFPDALAARTLEKLSGIAEEGGKGAPYFTDGTFAGTKRRMKEWGVDAFVTQHIATSPRSMRKVNDFAAQVRGEGVYSFGSVHPDAPDALEELDRIRALGLDGVKLHPDYQNFFVDEDRMAKLYERMAALRLPLLLHAGWDPLSPDLVHAEPERIARVLDGCPDLVVIAAHLGGMRRYDAVEKHLLGRRNLYLDTAMTSPYLHDPAQYARIMRGHGLDRILFATDCPWSTPERELQLLEGIGLEAEERERVTARNALALLSGAHPFP